MSDKIDEKSVIARIKNLREKHSGKRGKALFAKNLGISPSTYNYYEKDRIPPIDVLWNICQATGTDLHWLLSGQEKITNTTNKNSETNDPLTIKIKELMNQDPQSVRALEAFIDLYQQKIRVENNLNVNNTINYDKTAQHDAKPPWLPVLGRTAAGIAHFWEQNDRQLPVITEFTELIARHQKSSHRHQQPRQILTDITQPDILPLDHKSVSLVQLNEPNPDGISEFIESEEILTHYPDAFALRVDGDSMAPRIQDADIIILSPSVPARDGAAAVIKIKNQIGVTCKIIRKTRNHIHLIAANENYETKIFDIDQILWSLAVIWRIRLA